MIACPVCQHAQEHGAECEVCGKRLVAGLTPADRAIAPIEGLEPTGFVQANVLEEPLPDLEPTLRGADAPVVEERTPGLEATRAPPVDVGDAPPVPDLERTAQEIPDDAPAALPDAAICRYCRTPAAPGDRLCARCGVRLPVVRRTTSREEPDRLRVCTCGTTVRPGAALCPSCGARLG